MVLIILNLFSASWTHTLADTLVTHLSYWLMLITLIMVAYITYLLLFPWNPPLIPSWLPPAKKKPIRN